MTEFGPAGASVYHSRYARKKSDGTRETWPETVRRVVDGNLGLVSSKYHMEGERDALVEMIENFQIIPAGRHLSASGVPGRQFLFNCHVSGWGSAPWEHFEFTFLRLMEGGGVGANYSNRYLSKFPPVKQELDVHIVCDPDHPDYAEMSESGLLSSDYSHEWPGAYPVEDSREGWASALADLLSTYYREDVRYGSRVYDVSRVRAKGEPLRQFGGTASGPAPLAQMLHETSQVMDRHRDEKLSGMGAMEIDHAIAQCVVSGGVRRSARMSIMHWDDPEIVSFLICKENTGKHWTTNISVEVDAEFWRQVSEGNTWASAVLESVSTGMLRDGEPGIWDSFLSNHGEPDGVIATNPCGEIALEPWENCNLGHVNLSAFVDESGTLNAGPVIRAHRLMTRFLIRATYGDVRDSKQAETLAKNRRIGVGHFGFAGMVAKMGIKYSEVPDNGTVRRVLDSLYEVVQSVSADYSHHLRIPAPAKTTTVAPTGTIAKLPGASEGIHPIFSRYFIRRVRMSSIDEEDQRVTASYLEDGFQVEPCQYAPNTDVVSIPTRDLLMDQVAEIHGEEEAHRIVESAGDLTVVDMLRVQAMYQEIWADNAVSYTANVDPELYSAEDLSAILREFGGQVKGFTVFPEMSRPQSPYERITKEDYERAYATEVADGVDEDCASGACPVN